MNPSYGVPRGTILECISQAFVETVPSEPRSVEAALSKSPSAEYEIEWGRLMLKVPSCPIFQVITPETPNLWGARGDLEPVMAHQEEVVRSLLQPSKICLAGDIPTENFPEYFGRKSGHVQKRVPSAFEFDDCHLVPPDLLLQSPYRHDINFATQTRGLVRDLA